MEQAIELNVKLTEYMEAVENQAKPLIIPLSVEMLLNGVRPTGVFSALRGENGFILESLEGSEKISRYSFVGLNPQLVVSIDYDGIELEGDSQFKSIAAEPEGGTPVDIMKSIMRRFNFVNLRSPRFFGGMVGYFAYDLTYYLTDKVCRTTERDIETPVAQFMLVKDCVVFDHMYDKLYIFNSPLLTYESDFEGEYELSRARIIEIKSQIERRLRECAESNHRTGREFDLKNLNDKKLNNKKCKSNTDKNEFEEAVRRAKEYIFAGDIFQVVLSRRIDLCSSIDSLLLYQVLSKINPSPYMYLLEFGDLKIIGCSPEMLVRVENGSVMSVPIAGTRPRGGNKQEDIALEKELLSDEKEKAEHVMLVDLARNDIGRISKYGSVEVENFMSVEKFSHVQHIVSTVTGKLQDNRDCYDVLKSCFPAGTVSGAPKIRAMQIIEELEKNTRGIYAGAVGYFGFNWNMDFAIAIRTIIMENGTAHVQVGAGIVADSDPESEWLETESKGRAMLKAIEMAAEEVDLT